MLLYLIVVYTLMIPFYRMDVKSWATYPSTFFLMLLPSFGLYVLTLVRGIVYNKKHNIE
jgi:hypothetical protein